jgi:hypothetical protein
MLMRQLYTGNLFIMGRIIIIEDWLCGGLELVELVLFDFMELTVIFFYLQC